MSDENQRKSLAQLAAEHRSTIVAQQSKKQSRSVLPFDYQRVSTRSKIAPRIRLSPVEISPSSAVHDETYRSRNRDFLEFEHDESLRRHLRSLSRVSRRSHSIAHGKACLEDLSRLHHIRSSNQKQSSLALALAVEEQRTKEDLLVVQITLEYVSQHVVDGPDEIDRRQSIESDHQPQLDLCR